MEEVKWETTVEDVRRVFRNMRAGGYEHVDGLHELTAVDFWNRLDKSLIDKEVSRCVLDPDSPLYLEEQVRLAYDEIIRQIVYPSSQYNDDESESQVEWE